jgi:flagellar biosynthesis/type III secretory pathway protein FliH
MRTAQLRVPWHPKLRSPIAEPVITGILPSMTDTDKTREIQDKATDKLTSLAVEFAVEQFDEGYDEGYAEGYEAGRAAALAEAKA